MTKNKYKCCIIPSRRYVVEREVPPVYENGTCSFKCELLRHFVIGKPDCSHCYECQINLHIPEKVLIKDMLLGNYLTSFPGPECPRYEESVEKKGKEK
jgi:hypothetical protein